MASKQASKQSSEERISCASYSLYMNIIFILLRIIYVKFPPQIALTWCRKYIFWSTVLWFFRTLLSIFYYFINWIFYFYHSEIKKDEKIDAFDIKYFPNNKPPHHFQAFHTQIRHVLTDRQSIQFKIHCTVKFNLKIYDKERKPIIQMNYLVMASFSLCCIHSFIDLLYIAHSKWLLLTLNINFWVKKKGMQWKMSDS